jgi:hypothetical protein
MPVVPILIFKGAPMARSVNKTSGLIRKGAVGHILKRSKGLLRYISPITIYLKLRARSSKLEVIFPFVLIHPAPFIPSRMAVGIVFSWFLPAVIGKLMVNED